MQTVDDKDKPQAAPLASVPVSRHSRRQKAAMIVRLMLADGVRPSFAGFPEDLQIELAREVAALRPVDSATLAAVAREFAEELDSMALPASGGLDAALADFGDQLSKQATERLRAEQTSRSGEADPWVTVIALDPLDLVPLMEDESTEVAAVALSKLPVAKAAEVLRLLKGARARLIAHAVSQTAAIAPAAVARIGAALAREYSKTTETAFALPAAQRMGAILNSTGAEIRDRLLSELGEDDPDYAGDLRKAIFTFADIPTRVAATDIPKVLREVDAGQLVVALAFAIANGGDEAAVVDHVLANMSKRMAAQIKEEVDEAGKIKRPDGEAAQTALITAIRSAADSGAITLIEEEEED